MKLRWKQFDLQLKHTFRISRSARDTVSVMILELEHDGIIGYGEASPSTRYGESIETIAQYFSTLDLARFDSPLFIDNILAYAEHLSPGNTSAKCALDIALYDWMGKKFNAPLYQIFGLNPSDAPLCSFTIAIDTKEVVEQKVREAEEYPILKVKVGLDNDREMISTIRSLTDKPLYVDANEGWKTKEHALESIEWLSDKNVVFVEQPMPAAQYDDIRWLRDRSKLPIIADESVIRLQDIPALSQAYHGINIKLMKCTGIREALKMIHTARATGMKIMMGCMIESAIGISAGAQLSPLLDYCDLDGNVLIGNDPFDGSRNSKGLLTLSTSPGIGVSPR